MITTAILINVSLLIMLSFLHVYWSIGGQADMSAFIPDVFYNQSKHRIPWPVKPAIGALIGVCALITIGNLNIFSPYISPSFFKWGTVVVGLLFGLRALGDYHYMGFFKKATGTRFAKNDTRYYSPVSALISVLSFAIVLL